MGRWYVMRTVPGREQEAAGLMERTLDRKLWDQCRILGKKKLFRADGRLILTRETMFPGYLFVETDAPERLADELVKSREYPKFIGNGPADIVAVEEADMRFLESICGDGLQNDMELSPVEVDGEGNLTHIEGVLKQYEDRIVRKRLRKRYVLAEVPLFQRKEKVLFGICLPEDGIQD